MIKNIALRIAGLALLVAAAASVTTTAYAEDVTTPQAEPTPGVVVTETPDPHNPWG
ncbi:hypothetical protein R6L23_06575 [Streptomyces sp. SR27]|uniref:hypothetical protein n=1 Tax=unclassified Streptomyces TaxID=2593676 RepID=UPI00295B70F9|nr:hypothetical protein [Streptomyces sp. SR27]MDV9187879.1 hypothetical protein [Streptomyces sp. SR27]